MPPPNQKPDNCEVRKACIQHWEALKRERNSWEAHWRELSDYFLPRRSKFLSGEKTQGGRRNDKIVNSIGTFAVRTLGAGMMSGITSPARQWFHLTTQDTPASKSNAVRKWLDDIERRLLLLLAKSNIYNSLSVLYPDLATFGVSCLYVEDDVETVFRSYVQPVGVYALANSERMQVDTVYRHLTMTVKQAVSKFGMEACSQRVRSAFEKHNLLEKVTVLHAVYPNADFNPGRMTPDAMRFVSLWLEMECGEGEGFLHRGGFHECPYMCPRWESTAEEAYGTGPGMLVLGDVKALQLYERRKAQAVEKIVDPPMVGPTSLENARISLLPGDVTYVDLLGPGQKFEPAVVVPPQVVGAVTESIREHEQRIKQGFFADLWLMLSESDNRMTATEVMERHQEKMLQLGPVLERLEQELLTPLVLRVLSIMLRRGLLPPPPQALAGQGLRVEYTSVMSDAQRLEKSQKLDKLMASVGNLVAVKPEVLDKVDCDAVVDEYAQSLGLDGAVLRDEADVAALRQGRAQQAQAQAAMQQQMAMAQGAKTLSQADTGGDNALTRLMGPMQAAAATGGNVLAPTGPGAGGGLPQ